MILAPAIGIGFVLWAIAGFGPALHWWEFVGIGWLLGDRIALRQEIERRCREFNAWAAKWQTLPEDRVAQVTLGAEYPHCPNPYSDGECVIYTPGSTRPN